MQKAGEFFNVDYISTSSDVDTELATIKSGKLVLLFSYELTKPQKESLFNNVTKKDSYKLPSIDNALDRLGGSQYFSAMDLISGYWQIDLPKEDQKKEAIIMSQGLLQPTKMP